MKKIKLNKFLLIAIMNCAFVHLIAQPDPIPIGSGDGISVVPGDLTLMDPQLTPPCNVSNTCVETDKYIPVWRWNATSRVMDACPLLSL